MLRRAGHEAEHLYDIGMLNAPDREIWHHAQERSAAILTKDGDFAAMRMNAESGPAVVWLRLGNVGNDTLLAVVERALPEIVGALDAGETLVELR